MPADSLRAGKFLTGPNQWPKSLSADEFEIPLQKYRGQMVKLSELVLDLLALSLPAPATPDLFKDFMFQPSGNLRLLHYPPKPVVNKEQLGCKSV